MTMVQTEQVMETYSSDAMLRHLYLIFILSHILSLLLCAPASSALVDHV